MAAAGGGWKAYYQQTGERPPRRTLLFALDRFDAEPAEAPRFAVDLGCGSGRDTVEILRRGWRVLGIDAQPEAIEALRQRAGTVPGAAERLETRVIPFDDPTLVLPAADLINSSFALPGADPARFPALWAGITAALRPGGRFAGQLYGERDSWRTRHAGMTFLTATEARALLGGLSVELFEEEETDSVTPRGEAKHWHIFHVVARKSP